MEISAQAVNELRQRTGVGLMTAKKALQEAAGNMEKALASLKAQGAEVASKKEGRLAGEGLVDSYTHSGRISAMVEVNCETDFVARNNEFRAFVHDVAMQVASMAPQTVDELYDSPFIKDESKTIRELRNELVQKIGENIQIKRFVRFELGE